MQKYSPSDPPDPLTWLGLAEDDRAHLVEHFHRKARVRLPNLKVHALIHVIVENQLAEAIPEVVDAMRRLLNQGLDRHEALHAIGSVLTTHIFNVTTKSPGDGDPHAAYFRALESLSVESWRGTV